MSINQSLIKRTAKRYCPKKVRAELDGLSKRTASEAMIKGQYFEYLLFGTKNREGRIPVLEPKKNGEKKIDQIRIESQVKKFPEILRKYGIEVFGTDRTFSHFMFGTDTHGTWDAYGLIKRIPLIIDIKLTQNVDNDFGDFSWGDFGSMDKIQAEMYMEAGRRMDRLPYDFLFMVFDYQPEPQYRLFHVPYTPNVHLQVQERIEETISKIQYHNAHGWEAVGHIDECRDCPFMLDCPNFTTKKKVREKWANRVGAKEQRMVQQHEDEKGLENLIADVFK